MSLVHIDAVRVIESQKQAVTQQTTAHKTVMALFCDSITLTASMCTRDISWSDTVLI
jgi:hypothetical protein